MDKSKIRERDHRVVDSGLWKVKKTVESFEADAGFFSPAPVDMCITAR